jgi:hypothetical protein
MWGLLFASVGNGLGKSLNVLDDAEMPKVQKVSKTHLSFISWKLRCALTQSLDLLCKPYHTLHRTRSIEMLHPYSRPGSLQAERQGITLS